MATKPRTRVLTALVLVAGLAGCSSGNPQTEPTAPSTPEVTATTDETPTPTPATAETEEVEPLDDGALPPGFPDPASLVGQQTHDEQAADGTWHAVVGDQALELVNFLGFCFVGNGGDVCTYSIAASAPAAGTWPLPTEQALLLLRRNAGNLPDGTVTWLILDAVITDAPSGEPAYMDVCDGTPGVAIWHQIDDPPQPTVTPLGAWGTDPDVTALVELDPTTLSCPYIGG